MEHQLRSDRPYSEARGGEETDQLKTDWPAKSAAVCGAVVEGNTVEINTAKGIPTCGGASDWHSGQGLGLDSQSARQLRVLVWLGRQGQDSRGGSSKGALK